MEQHLPSIVSLTTTAVVPSPSTSTPINHHHYQQQLHHQKSLFTRSATLGPQSPALRPEELRVKPWYAIDENSPVSKDSPLGLSSSSVYQSNELENNNCKEAMSKRGVDVASTRTSSIESENPCTRVPRRTCMDLNDAIALLDEIYSNADASPRMTPKTPRTPLTPHPRNKRARSKSSDNSSNYSGERLNERFLENTKSQEKERKRPFLKKIGISMTEDRPLLAKLAPKIMGKPYLEKIGPSRAIDKPFLENIGSSKTLDKFIFDMPKINKRQDAYMSSKTGITEETSDKASIQRRNEIRGFTTGERRKSGKNFLLKMYSFETEDLEENSLVMKVPHRDPLRGASLDDVVDSRVNNVPHINESCPTTNSDIETPCVSVAELVKCRVTTSDEIISSNSYLNSPMGVVSWENSPKRRGHPDRSNDIAISSNETIRIGKERDNNVSVPNSPIKKISTSLVPKKLTAVYKELDRVKSNRQISEDILDKRKIRHEQFERRGVSSDNLAKERVATPVYEKIIKDTKAVDVNGKSSSTSVISTTSSVKQMQDRFENQEIFTETYADFKRRAQSNLHASNALKRLIVKEKSTSPSLHYISKDIVEKIKPEISPKFRSRSVENHKQNYNSKDQSESQGRRLRARSVLRKQQGVDHCHYPNEQSALDSESIQRRKIVHEPSQETLDLLSELQKVKSLLKTPSIDRPYETNNTSQLKPFPKKILLTDKEFCLSIERENSIRRPSRENSIETRHNNSRTTSPSADKNIDTNALGPALFEKRCLSLDYADEEKSTSQKAEPRVLLALGSARNPLCEDILEASQIALGTPRSKNYGSDVLIAAAKKPIIGISVEQEVRKIEKELKSSKHECLNETSKISYVTHIEKGEMKGSGAENNDKSSETSNTPRSTGQFESTELGEEKRDDLYDNAEQLIKHINYHSEMEAANRELQASPKKKSLGQNNASDALEINSPKATPFRMKKRLGRISIEETVKQESFASNKVDCKEVAVQKRAKCLPL